MTPEQIQQLGAAFADYLEPFADCCDNPESFHRLGVYCRGLLSDLPRKRAEPIALYAGTAVRTLQEFLKDHCWSFGLARGTLPEHVADLLPTLPDDGTGTVGVVDESGTRTKGTKTPACSGSTAASGARSRTASSPSTSASPAALTRP